MATSTTSTKMTSFEFFTAVENGNITPEVIAHATAEKAKILAERAKAKEKRAEKAKENAPLLEKVMEFLATAPNFANAVGEALGVSTSKASYLLRELEADGKVTSEMAKAPNAKSKSKCYTVVAD